MALNIKEYVRECINKYLPLIKDRFNGDSSTRFKVADAINNDEAVSKGQLNDELTNKADKHGNHSYNFHVADGTAHFDAVNKGQLDGKADLQGDSANTFSVSEATDANHAVNKALLDYEVSEIQSTLESKAHVNGNSGMTFKVKNATASNHAVNKGQIEDMLDKPAFSARMETNTTASNTWHVDNFTRVTLNNKSCFNPSTGVFTAPEDGLYKFSVALSWQGGDGTDDTIQYFFIVAGVKHGRLYSNPRYSSGNGKEILDALSQAFELSSGDTVIFSIENWQSDTYVRYAEFNGFKI